MGFIFFDRNIVISKCSCFLTRGDNEPHSQMEGLQQCSVCANTSAVNRLSFGYSPTRVTGQLVALVISSPRTAGQLIAKTRCQNEKVSSLWVCVMLNKTLRPKKKSVFGVIWQKKRGSVGRLFFFFFLVGPWTSACTSLMYFEKGVDANISCLRFGAGDP